MRLGWRRAGNGERPEKPQASPEEGMSPDREADHPGVGGERQAGAGQGKGRSPVTVALWGIKAASALTPRRRSPNDYGRELRC